MTVITSPSTTGISRGLCVGPSDEIYLTRLLRPAMLIVAMDTGYRGWP